MCCKYCSGDTIMSGQVLHQNSVLKSRNGLFEFHVHSVGNLVIYSKIDDDLIPSWESHTEKYDRMLFCANPNQVDRLEISVTLEHLLIIRIIKSFSTF